MNVCRLERVSKRFMGRTALSDVHFAVRRNEILGLVGPNGAGKTTIVNILTGYLLPDEGAVYLGDRRIDRLQPFRISRLGIRRTFQLSKNFMRLSVLENCLVAAEATGVPRPVAEERAAAILEDLTLSRLANSEASELSGGQHKLLEFATCFMSDPDVICLDEPFAAVHPDIKQVILRYVRAQHEAGKTFLLISHDIPFVKNVCTRLVALSAGRVIAEGPTERVLDNPDVIDAYLVSEV